MIHMFPVFKYSFWVEFEHFFKTSKTVFWGSGKRIICAFRVWRGLVVGEKNRGLLDGMDRSGVLVGVRTSELMFFWVFWTQGSS